MPSYKYNSVEGRKRAAQETMKVLERQKQARPKKKGTKSE